MLTFSCSALNYLHLLSVYIKNITVSLLIVPQLNIFITQAMICNKNMRPLYFVCRELNQGLIMNLFYLIYRTKHVSFARSHTLTTFDDSVMPAAVGSNRFRRDCERLLDGRTIKVMEMISST